MSERKCVNCAHNIRSNGDCHCDIDGHFIGYIACFEDWCRRWKRDRRFDTEGKPDSEDVATTDAFGKAK